MKDPEERQLISTADLLGGRAVTVTTANKKWIIL